MKLRDKIIAALIAGATITYFAASPDVKIFVPSPKIECEIESIELTYSQAEAMMKHYIDKSNALNSSTSRIITSRYKDFPLGDNISDCMLYEMRKLMKRAPYHGKYGISFRYGIKASSSNRETERYAIFLPLESDGKFDAALIDTETRLRYMLLDQNFNDPCPDWCDR